MRSFARLEFAHVLIGEPLISSPGHALDGDALVTSIASA
jgi:hypothetical protein